MIKQIVEDAKIISLSTKILLNSQRTLLLSSAQAMMDTSVAMMVYENLVIVFVPKNHCSHMYMTSCAVSINMFKIQ